VIHAVCTGFRLWQMQNLAIYWKSNQVRLWPQIWQMPLQLQFVQLITDKSNAADLSSGVFIILISYPDEKKYKIHCHFTNFAKNWQTVM